MNSDIKLSIIIVNYNVAYEVAQCIESIFRVIKGDYEIIVIDNNSIERDIESLAKKYSSVKFYFLKENIGFAGANNYAVDFCQGENILFLNPDTIIIENFVTPILDFVRQNEKVGACGPVLLNEDNSYQNSTGIRLGYLYEFCEAFMLINILRYFYKIKILNHIYSNLPVQVSWLSAACLMIKKKVFQSIGGFNSEFFLNYEDIDLCERIRKDGFNNYYFPQYKCIHLDKKSQIKNLDKFVYNRYYSRIIYCRNHYKLFKQKIIKTFHIIGLVARIVFGKLIYSGKEQEERTKGYIKALRLYFL